MSGTSHVEQKTSTEGLNVPSDANPSTGIDLVSDPTELGEEVQRRDLAVDEAREALKEQKDEMPVVLEDPELPSYQIENAQISEKYQKYLDAFNALDRSKIDEAREKYINASLKDVHTLTSRDFLFADIQIAEDLEGIAQELKLNKEADLLRMVAYVDLPPQKDGFFNILYPPAQELSVGFGEWIPKEIMQIQYKSNDSSEPIIANRSVLNGRICFVDQNNEYLASYSGDKVKLIPPGEEEGIQSSDRTLYSDEKAFDGYYRGLVDSEKEQRKQFSSSFKTDNEYADSYENPEGYGEDSGLIRGLEDLAVELSKTTPIDLNWYLSRASEVLKNGSEITKNRSMDLDFARFSKYGVDKGPLKCAYFVSDVLGISPKEGSIRKLLPRILAGVSKQGSVDATNKYSDFKEGSVYSLLFYEQGMRAKGGKWLSHIALGSVSTINGSKCMIASHEGSSGASIVVNVLSGSVPSEEEIASHLQNNPNKFLAKMGRWYSDPMRGHEKMRIQENKSNVYWSDNGSQKAFQFGVNVDSIVNL